MRIVSTRLLSEREYDVLHSLFVLRRRHMRRFVKQRKFHRHIDENTALIVVRFNDVFDNIEHGVQLAKCGGTATLADHRAKRLLDPAILHLKGGEHEVVLALEMLIEGRLADTYVGEHLVDADVPKTVAIKAAHRRFY